MATVYISQRDKDTGSNIFARDYQEKGQPCVMGRYNLLYPPFLPFHPSSPITLDE